MSKKTITIIIIVGIMITGIILGFYYVNKSPENKINGSEDTNFFLNLFNFGNRRNNTNEENTNTDVDSITDNEANGAEMQKMKLLKISSMPIAGYTVYAKERYVYVPDVEKTDTTESTEKIEGDTTEKIGATTTPSAPVTEYISSLRYVARENGNIYQTFVDQINERRFSDMVIPNVEEAFFGDNGESVIMRYVKENPLILTNAPVISTFTGSLPKEFLGGDSALENKISGSFLPDNITDLSISPDTYNLFYLYNVRNGAIGTTATFLGKNKIQVFDSSFTEWLSQWVNDNMITITTKPSYNFGGFMYKIDIIKKNFTKILGSVNGLTTLTSSDGKMVLYANNNLNLSIYNIENNENKSLNVRTLPEKCVWSKNNIYIYCAVPKFINGSEYPDIWYQGEVSFSDDIWKINAETGIATKVIDPLLPENQHIINQNIENIDGIKLQLSTEDKYLFFVNKIDSYLWGLELK